MVWAAFSLVLVATGVVKAYLPAVAVRVMPSCFMRNTLGIRCPTCGTGTSLMFLSEGRIHEALQASFLGPLMLVALVLFDLYLIGTFAVGRKLAFRLTRRDSLFVALAGFLVLGASWVQQLAIRP
jgi:hypothetical protein